MALKSITIKAVTSSHNRRVKFLSESSTLVLLENYKAWCPILSGRIRTPVLSNAFPFVKTEAPISTYVNEKWIHFIEHRYHQELSSEITD